MVTMLVVVLGLVVLWRYPTWDDRDAQKQSLPAVTSSAPQPTQTPTPTAEDIVVDDMHDEEDAGPCPQQVSLLQTRSAQFAEAWYELRPADTTKTRRARIAPYVTPGFYDTYGVVVDRSAPAEKARIAEGNVFLAHADQGVAEVTCSADFDSEAATHLRVTTREETKGGTPIGEPLTVELTIRWILKGSDWRAETITERW